MNSINKNIKKEVFVEKKKGKEIKEKDYSDIMIEEDDKEEKVDEEKEKTKVKEKESEKKEKGKKGENINDEEYDEKSR